MARRGQPPDYVKTVELELHHSWENVRYVSDTLMPNKAAQIHLHGANIKRLRLTAGRWLRG